MQERLEGLPIQPRPEGEVHSVYVGLTRNWGLGMAYELEQLGPVSIFDWEKFGFYEGSNDTRRRLPELNETLFKFLKETNRKRPIDWILMPCSGEIILRDIPKRIREELGIPTVNQWLDCKQVFETGRTFHGQDSGMKDIAPEFDLIWSSARPCCDWYLAVGARPVFMGEGFSPRLIPKVDCAKKHDVGFVGARYGLRPDYVDALRRAGLRVEVRGPGWGTRMVPFSEMAEFFGQCKVNLGMGGVGYSMSLTTLKGRDFEVPGAGGAYLTTFNPDLAEHFHVGNEILCYRNIDEMIELARLLVNDDQRREQLAANAYHRAMREHRWLHRFRDVLGLLGVLKSNRSERRCA